MTRFRLFLVLALVALSVPAHAQRATRIDRPIVSRFDVDTPTIAATTNRIVTVVNLTNTTFTIAAQPDVPRNVTITVVDTTPSITVGTVTVTCLDVNGATITEVLNLATALTLTGTKACASVVSVISAGASTLGGAGDETIIVGVGSVVSYRFCLLGDPVNASGSAVTAGSSATVTSAGSAFTPVGVGDELTFANVNGTYTRVVTARASALSITVDTAVNLGSAGTVFSYRTLTCGYGDTAGWVGLQPDHQSIGLIVNQATATGGVDYVIQGRQRRGLGFPIPLVSGNFSAARVVGVAPTTTSANVYEIADTMTEVRVGLKLGTTDDSSDTGPELVDVNMTTEVR